MSDIDRAEAAVGSGVLGGIVAGAAIWAAVIMLLVALGMGR